MKWFFAILAVLAIAIIFSKIKSSNKSITHSKNFQSRYNSETESKFNYDSAREAKRIIDSIAAAATKKERDSVIRILKSKFRVSKDEFEETGYVHHLSSPKYVNYNGVFFYFEKSNELAENLRLKIQYAADDWLFIDHYIFNIDGENITVRDPNMERDHSSGRVYEWGDIPYGTNSDLFNKLKQAKVVKIKFVGSQYYDTKTLSKSQVKALSETFAYYKALGGKVYF